MEFMQAVLEGNIKLLLLAKRHEARTSYWDQPQIALNPLITELDDDRRNYGRTDDAQAFFQ